MFFAIKNLIETTFHFPMLYSEEARKEHITLLVMGSLTLCVGCFAVLALLGWFAGIFSSHLFTILIPIFLIALTGWTLAYRGQWKWVRHAPAVLFFAAGMYCSMTSGSQTVYIIFYIIAFLVNNLLVSTEYMIFTAAASFFVHYGISMFSHHAVSMESAVAVGAVFSGICLLQWIFNKMMNLAITHSSIDGMTGLFNRAYFDTELQRLRNSRKYPISIILADVNRLKVVNDTMGHNAGDQILLEAAKIFKKSFRDEDAICRIGGDEFGIVLPQTDQASADKVIERIQARIEEHNQDSSALKLSIAFGSAEVQKGLQLSEVLQLADRRMYHNKHECRA